MTADIWEDLQKDAWEVAPALLGCIIERDLNGVVLQGRIVETEAYDQTDAASQSYRGRTPRTDVMFGPPGRLYVFFTYGMHFCCNVVTGPEGQGSAVLIRAVEPLVGNEKMCELRGGRDGIDMTNGPAKVCQAFDIGRSLNGHDLRTSPFKLLPGKRPASDEIVETTRIGITRDTHRLWRFYIRGNPYVSKP